MDDRIARLALVDWPEGKAVPQIQELRPPALDDRAVLLVRRLSVVADPDDVPAAVAAEVQAGAARAVRPIRGGLALEAEAVLFDDESQMLACYLLAASGHTLEHHWCWPLLRTTLPPPSLRAVVSDPSTPVLGVLAALIGWGRLVDVVGELDRATRWRVLTAIAERHDLWLREVAAVDPTTGDPGGGRGSNGWSPEQSPAEEGVGLRLGGVLSARGAKGDLGAASTRTTSHDSPADWAPSGRRVGSGGLPGWHVGREGSARALCHLPAGEDFPTGLARLVATLLGRRSGVGDGHRTLIHPGARGLEDVAQRLSPHTVPVALNSPRDEVESPAGRVPDSRTPSSAATGRETYALDHPGPGEGIEHGVRTNLGGVLYLVNLLRRFDLLEFGLVDADAWDVVDGLARAALSWSQGEGGAAPDRDGLTWDDPIWDLLSALAGREPGEAPEPVVVQCCREALRALLPALAFADDEPGWGTLLAVPGRVTSDATHVELFTALTQVHLSIRRRALDSDPGWVPALGRVVLFHFTGGQR
ncbi:hypothetical protein [Nocardioides gilvus]|uniref:hypothetical protein n=1 Tax=Nocardioides gilvus TaxID=1735589 RepID=UPI0013A53653|nr:hypothetical protein [Nocardioides gilvus]